MTAKPRTNPFRPGVGTPPLVLVGRDRAISTFKAVLRGAPDLPANMRLTGLRGVGKTVLLQKFYSTAVESNWFASSVELQPGHNSEKTMKDLLFQIISDAEAKMSRAERIKASLHKTAEHVVKSISVSYSDMTFQYQGVPDRDQDITKRLFEVTELAVKKGYLGYLLLLDEAQVIKDETSASGQHPLSMLIACVSSLQRNGLPIGLVLCGLPTLTSNLLRARSYTERMFRGELVSSLNKEDALKAFVEPLKKSGIEWSEDLAKEVIEEVEGYPYFIQLWGAELWEASMEGNTNLLTPALLDAIRPHIYQRLDLDFYEPRVHTLTPAEQDVLLSTAGCSYPPIVVSDLKTVSDKTPENINVLLGRLVESGVLFRVRQGQYDYTAPKFRQYLLRRPR
ncbi:MAG: ATP-binding protein [Candidatus Margulisiibacteriota bacterium]